MKYVVAAVALAFVIAAAPQADAARAKSWDQMNLNEKFERSAQCSARANDQKIALDKRIDFIEKCKRGRA